MSFRIETSYKVPDARSVTRRGFFNSLIGKEKVRKVEIVDAYTVDARFRPKQMQTAAELLTNRLIENYQILHPLLASPVKGEQNIKFPSLEGRGKGRVIFDYAIEISFLPGVTDNIGHTAKETLADGAKVKFKPGQNVYSSQVLFILGRSLTTREVKKIADSLYNPLIQRVTIKTFEQFKTDGGLNSVVPKVKLTTSSKVAKVDLNINNKELTELGKFGIKNNDGGRRGPLALELYQLKAIRDYFNKIERQPTDVELEMLAQTWSEHCKHIIFNSPVDNIKEGLFKKYIKGATDVVRAKKASRDFCVSVFKDNSGAIAFDKDFLITHKVETHNTPSALDPFGGSITGIVGVNRDCLGFGLGAKPTVNTFGFCLAEPNDQRELYRDAAKKNKMLSARRILDGVVSGINAGGNQSGIPTNSGFLYFDPQYRGKPLVFAGTVGLIPRKIDGRLSHIKQARPNDLVVMIGGWVGLDGIHGATFSSENLDAHSPATAVQIGDPITQKKLSDAIVREARGLFNSITDCGAGGLSSAVGEMARESNGCLVQLDKVPAKYPGLAPWQIWISESQERMVLAVPPKKWPKFKRLMARRGVEGSIIGKFTSHGKCTVKYGSQTVADIDLEFLHNGLPKKHLKTQAPKPKKKKDYGPAPKLKIENYKLKILELLGSRNLASTAFLNTQYDHEVQGGSVLKPLQGRGLVNADATVTRPVLTSKKGIVLSSALYPEYSDADAFYAASLAIDSAIRQAVAAGANPDYIALLDNFCWSSPKDPKRLWQLKQAAKACFDYATAFGAPFISGKDSMHNDFKGFDHGAKPVKISIPPTLLISAIGVIENVSKSISLDAKLPGDLIYVLGNTPPLKIRGGKGVILPEIHADKNLKLYRAFYQAAQNNLIASAISIGRGGLAVALAKMAIAGQLGVECNVPTYRHFEPIPGAIVASVDPKKMEKFEQVMQGSPLVKIGVVSRKPTITITFNDKSSVKIPLSQATKAYHSTFKNF